MPSFAWKLNNQQVAEVATYIRNTWGNRAEQVSSEQVDRPACQARAARRSSQGHEELTKSARDTAVFSLPSYVGGGTRKIVCRSPAARPWLERLLRCHWDKGCLCSPPRPRGIQLAVEAEVARHSTHRMPSPPTMVIDEVIV